MDDLIARVLSGEASEIEARALARWRESSPENERTWTRAQRLWIGLELPTLEPPPPPPTLDIVVAEAESRRGRAERRQTWFRRVRSPWTAYGFAAAAVAALLLIVIPSRRSEAGAALSLVESSTGTSDVTTMTLSDGSVVRAAPATDIEFPASTNREVVLEGRAFFAVASAPAPFVVRTATGMVTVTGTRFEVREEDGALRVVVVEGTVRLGGRRGEAVLGPGQVGFLDGTGVPRVVEQDDVWSLLDWKGGLLVFQGTPLRQVAEEIGRQFGRRVVVEAGLEDRRVTVWFDEGTIDEVVSAVCLVTGASCRVGEETVSIGR